MSKCCVPDCQISSEYLKYRLHRLPKNKSILKIWIQRSGSLSKSSSQFMCGRHFYDSQFSDNVRRRLIPNALPCRFLPLEYPEPAQVLSFITHKQENLSPSEIINAAERVNQLMAKRKQLIENNKNKLKINNVLVSENLNQASTSVAAAGINVQNENVADVINLKNNRSAKKRKSKTILSKSHLEIDCEQNLGKNNDLDKSNNQNKTSLKNNIDELKRRKRAKRRRILREKFEKKKKIQFAVMKSATHSGGTLVKLDLKETKFIDNSDMELDDKVTLNTSTEFNESFDIDTSVKILNTTKLTEDLYPPLRSQYLDLKNIKSDISTFGDAVKDNEVFLKKLMKMADLSKNFSELEPQFVYVPGEGNVPVYTISLNIPYVGVTNYAITLGYDTQKGIIPIATNYLPALERNEINSKQFRALTQASLLPKTNKVNSFNNTLFEPVQVVTAFGKSVSKFVILDKKLNNSTNISKNTPLENAQEKKYKPYETPVLNINTGKKFVKLSSFDNVSNLKKLTNYLCKKACTPLLQSDMKQSKTLESQKDTDETNALQFKSKSEIHDYKSKTSETEKNYTNEISRKYDNSLKIINMETEGTTILGAIQNSETGLKEIRGTQPQELNNPLVLQDGKPVFVEEGIEQIKGSEDIQEFYCLTSQEINNPVVRGDENCKFIRKTSLPGSQTLVELNKSDNGAEPGEVLFVNNLENDRSGIYEEAKKIGIAMI